MHAPTRKALAFGFVLATLCAAPTLVSAATSVSIIDFNLFNGDFTVVSTNSPPAPWAWDADRGSWSAFDTNDCATPFRSSRLLSPILTVPSAGVVTLTFTHRYSFEADTTRWDGGQLRVSVNGGNYVTVPSGNFTSGGYNNTVGGASVPNSEIAGQQAFTAQSDGYDLGVYITSVARLGTFNANDTVSVQFLGAWDDCAQGTVPNWEIDSVQFTPPLEDRRSVPTFTNPNLPADAAVLEGRAHTLSVEVSGQVSLQWYKDGDPILFATATSYTITNMSTADVGRYSVRAANSIGSSVSRLANVTLIPDRTAPVLLYAFNDPIDLQKFTTTADEPLCDQPLVCGTDAQDSLVYVIETLDGAEQLGVISAVLINRTNVVLSTAFPRDPAKSYRIRVDPIGDPFNNSTATQVEIKDTLVFQQNLNGYTGTVDTELRGAAPSTVQAANAFVTVDLSDGGGISQGLLRYDNLFGPGAGQVPIGAIIVSAELTLRHTVAGANGSLVELHRMLVPWDDDVATYNSFVNGIQTDGIEAAAAIDATIDSLALAPPFTYTVNVTPTVQAWANAAPNYGWAFVSTGADGYRWDTSETANAPTLAIRYVLPPCAPVAITQQPAANTTVNEGNPFTLSVSATSQGCLATYQWSLGGVDIPGATGPSYGVASANPTVHSGVYRVRVANSLPSSVTSSPATVTVTPDTTRPTLVHAEGSIDGTTITLVFSERMKASSALQTANYVLAPSLPVISAAEANGTNIILTTGTRAFPTTYNLTINNLTDNANASNPLNPSPTVVSIATDTRVLIPWGAVWKYETNNLDATLGTGSPWYSPGFDDSLWPAGPGLLGLETSAAAVARLPIPLATGLPVNATQSAYYFRRQINVPSLPAGAEYALCHFVDDGAIFYLDGVEISRYNMTNPPPVLFADFASAVPAGDGDGSLLCFPISLTPNVPHTLAVEVHQATSTSSDVVFGTEIRGIVRPTLHATRNADGSVTISWAASRSWQLLSSADVAGPYTAVAGDPGSPVTVAAGALAAGTFYTLHYLGR